MDTRCRELRLAAGLSQAEVARAVGMSQNAISSLERGDTVLDLVWMRRLAPLYGCTPADFLADADNPDRLTAEEAALIHRTPRLQRDRPPVAFFLRVAPW